MFLKNFVMYCIKMFSLALTYPHSVFISSLGGTYLSPFSCCHVGQTVSVAAASAHGRFGQQTGLVSQPLIGPRGQELLTVDFALLNAPTTGL